MAVYLIHFNPKLGHAGHYCGYAQDVQARFAEHLAGKGARICQVAIERGIRLHLVRQWPGGDRTFERKLKDGSLTELCPLCREASIRRRIQQQKERRIKRRQERQQLALQAPF
jgi:predicted GIY-YIG superfamily endonuclease